MARASGVPSRTRRRKTVRPATVALFITTSPAPGAVISVLLLPIEEREERVSFHHARKTGHHTDVLLSVSPVGILKVPFSVPVAGIGVGVRTPKISVRSPKAPPAFDACGKGAADRSQRPTRSRLRTTALRAARPDSLSPTRRTSGRQTRPR